MIRGNALNGIKRINYVDSCRKTPQNSNPSKFINLLPSRGYVVGWGGIGRFRNVSSQSRLIYHGRGQGLNSEGNCGVKRNKRNIIEGSILTVEASIRFIPYYRGQFN